MKAALLAAAVALTAFDGVSANEQAGAYLAARHAERSGDAAAAARYLSEALRQGSEAPTLALRAALHLAASGRIDDAAGVVTASPEAFESEHLGALILIVRDLADGHIAQARARLDQTDDLQPLMGRLAQAWTALAADDAPAALQALDAVDERPVYQLFAAYHRGLILSQTGDWAAAADAFDASRALMDRPTARFALSRARAQFLAGRVDAARETLKLAARRGVSDPRISAALQALDKGEAPLAVISTPLEGAAEALLNIASVVSEEAGGLIAQAHAQAALHLDPTLDEARILTAQIFGSQHQPALAVSMFEAVPAASALAVEAVIGRARGLELLGRLDAAREALAAAAREREASVELRLALGDLLRRASDWAPCAEAYGEALALLEAKGAQDWRVYYQRGICNERGGRWPAAERDLKKAMALEPEQPLVLNYLGYSWIDLGVNIKEGRALVERAVAMAPDDGYIMDSLGWAQYRVEEYDAAVETLERAASLAPVDPVINDHLGDALWMVGRKREARFQWKRARSFQPAPKDLERINRKLERGLDAVRAAESQDADGG